VRGGTARRTAAQRPTRKPIRKYTDRFNPRITSQAAGALALAALSQRRK
jgi:hypothetical protein